MTRFRALAMGLLLASAGTVKADEPRPVPLTRPEMKQFLEDMKARKPRIPLPELTADEKAKLGEREAGYEARLRTLYLPEGWGFGGPRPAASAGGAAPAPAAGGLGRNTDPNMSLDYAFKTELFWIVSRANNCQYCQGHQESKLLAAGLKEDEIAALDGDWSEFTPAQRSAFAFARKLTYEPDHLTDADIDGLRKDYKDLQILEMILSVAGNNAINRWKEGAGVPQSSGGGNFSRRTAAGAVAAPGLEAPAHPQSLPDANPGEVPDPDHPGRARRERSPDRRADEAHGLQAAPARNAGRGRKGPRRREQAGPSPAAPGRSPGPRGRLGSLARRAAPPVGPPGGQLPPGRAQPGHQHPVGRGEGGPLTAPEGPGELDHRPTGSRLVRPRPGQAAPEGTRSDRRPDRQS